MSALPNQSAHGDAAVDFHVLQQAAEWFALLRSPSVSEGDIGAWRRWRDENVAHRSAWARVEEISGHFEHLPTSDKPTARATLDTAAQRQFARRRAVKMLALLCTTGTATWVASNAMPWRSWTAAYRTDVGQRKQIQLADGSDIWLNTASAMDADYSVTLRRVRLYAGEILIQTAKDVNVPARPFVVDTQEGRLRALGTRFTVRQRDGVSQIAVYDGAVEITPVHMHVPALVVQAGQQVSFSADGVDALATVEPMQQAWTRGMLIADDMRLGDLIAEVARYRRGHLGCAQEVADLKVVGAYSLDHTERILAAIEETLPVKVQYTLPWWVVVKAQ